MKMLEKVNVQNNLRAPSVRKTEEKKQHVSKMAVNIHIYHTD